MCKKKYNFRGSYKDLLQVFYMRAETDEINYTVDIVDERNSDFSRSENKQFRVSIVMTNRDLLCYCVQFPRLGCDGKFNVVIQMD